MSTPANRLATLSLVAFACLFTHAARADEARAFQLQSGADRDRSASLLNLPEELPGSVQQAMLGQIADQMNANMDSFTRTFADDSAAGGGDGSGGLALIAGILGFFPGFGLGHVISGHIGGFLLFLVIDLVIAGVFFIAFPIFGFAFWYLPGIIVFVVERVVEAFSAANAATSPGYADLTPAANTGRFPVEAGFKLFDF